MQAFTTLSVETPVRHRDTLPTQLAPCSSEWLVTHSRLHHIHAPVLQLVRQLGIWDRLKSAGRFLHLRLHCELPCLPIHLDPHLPVGNVTKSTCSPVW